MRKIVNISNLSFPDFDVEKMEFSPQEKTLKVFVQGAWLEENGGEMLGKGVLFFNNWESLSINRLDPVTDIWTLLENIPEYLVDLCEVRFLNSDVHLCGFGKTTGRWLEWRLKHTEMHAEFE